jgi:hypothetical protein
MIPSNICWGNIGHLVSRLAGELDLHGLLQLVHQFLHSYNSSDPFQKIEKWDPNWEETKTMNRIVHGATTTVTIFQTAIHVGGVNTVSNMMITTKRTALMSK